MNGSLLRVLRVVIRADSDPARQALFSTLMRSRLPVRLAFKAHELLAGTWASALLVSAYGLASLVRIAPPRNRDARVLTVAGQANARRQVAYIVSCIGPAECGAVRMA